MTRKLPGFVLFLLFPLLALAQQNGKLTGTVTDKDTKEPLGYATVKVITGGEVIGAIADDNGFYTVSPLTPGIYDVEISLIGYQKRIEKDVRINTETTTRFNVALVSSAKAIDEVVIETYKVPLIDKDNTSTGTKLMAKDIEKLPTRNINSVLATTAGVFSADDGGALNIRGNRGGDNIVYVNGIRQYGTSYPPVETVQEIAVITGGVPAQYGDALGGVISVTTKGAASKFRAGVQYETSRLFDKYQYDLAGINASGPLLKIKHTDEDGKETKRTILGYYTALQFNRQADGSPSAYGYQRASDATLASLATNPLRRTVQDNGAISYRSNIDYLQPSDFTHQTYQPNGASSLSQANLTLDFQPKENIVVSVGGNFNFNRTRGGGNIGGPNNNGPFGSSGNNNFNFFDYGRNTITDNYQYNGFIRFRQTFPNLFAKKEGSNGLSNFYYQLQADYSRDFNITKDPNFGNHIELYNYYGKFKEERIAVDARNVANKYFYVYQPGSSNKVDSIYVGTTPSGPGVPYPVVDGYSTRYRVLGNTISQGFFAGDGLPHFSYDPYAGAYPLTGINQQLLNPAEGQPRDVTNFFNFQGYGGLVNGTQNLAQNYGYFGYNPYGYNQTQYGQNSREQYRFSAQLAGDIGRHTVKLGFEYEQRVVTSYTAGYQQNSSGVQTVFSPWAAAQRLVNAHIINSPNVGTSNSSFTTTFDANGNRVITIDPDLPLNTTADGQVIGQTEYDKRLRSALGLPINKLINLQELDPKYLALSNFTGNEIFGDGQFRMATWQGYTPQGERLHKRTSFYDFFTDTVNRPIDAFRPIYTAAYIEDKFEINDLIIRAGVRFDRFDVNQPVLRDQRSLTRLTSAGDVDLSKFSNGTYQRPSTVGDDWAVYVNKTADEYQPAINGQGGNASEFSVVGYRNGNTWYDAGGNELQDYRSISANTGGNFYPLYDITGLTATQRSLQQRNGITTDAFTDFKPQLNILPRLAFSFPISEDALFFAHYDILTQRPASVAPNSTAGDSPNQNGNYASPQGYYLLKTSTSNPFLNNPNLKPQKKIDYQIGFQQKLSGNTAIKLSSFYSEIKDLIQVTNVLGGYPNPGYQTNGNQDFGVVYGAIAQFDYRKRGGAGFGFNASYQLQFAEGSASNFATALLNTTTPNLRNVTPQGYDQRHAIKLNFDYRIADGQGPEILGGHPLENVGINATFNAGSGLPYTRDVGVFGGRTQIQGGINGARLPWNNRTGLRIDKTFTFKGLTSSDRSSLNIYLYVQNLFDQRNVLGVYRKSGSPTDDGYLRSQYGQSIANSASIASPSTYAYYYNLMLLNPDNVSLPRRIRIGVSYNF